MMPHATYATLNTHNLAITWVWLGECGYKSVAVMGCGGEGGGSDGALWMMGFHWVVEMGVW